MWASVLASVLLLAQFGETPQEIASKAGRVGIEVTRRSGNIVVSDVTAGSSAEKMGLKVGDQVLRVDVENVVGKGQSAAAATLRGVYLSKVTLTVLPRGQMLPRTLEVARDVRLYDVSHTATASTDDLKTRDTAEDGDAAPVISVQIADYTHVSGTGPEEKVHRAFARSPADVATCVGALADVLPEKLDTLTATFTIKTAGIVTVRTDPPSGDLASCLGRKSGEWKVPKPGRKEPTVVKMTWTITRTSPAAAK